MVSVSWDVWESPEEHDRKVDMMPDERYREKIKKVIAMIEGANENRESAGNGTLPVA